MIGGVGECDHSFTLLKFYIFLTSRNNSKFAIRVLSGAKTIKILHFQ